MAGDWIKIDISLPEKPEIWQIAGMTGVDPDAVVGKLIKVWRWFDAHTENGNAVGVTYALVDHVSGVTGFAEAMALCGWLEQVGTTLTLPNFDRHNGKTAKNRALTAKRVASHKAKSNDEGNGQSVSDALPREEKRREEKKEQQLCAPPAGDAPTRADPIPYQAIVGMYNATLTNLPKVRELTAKRKTLIRSAWQASRDRQDTRFWEAYFATCSGDPFLNGTGPYRNGHENWRPDFDFLLRADTVTKTYERAMDAMERMA